MPPRHAKRQKGVNARIRDLERFLKLPTLAADLRETKERELQALMDVRRDKERVEREKKMAKRYRMVKFFERQKLTRRVESLTKKLKDSALKVKQRAPLEVELAEAQRKLNYVMYFPRGIKYISVLKGGDEMASEAIAKRAEILNDINARLEAGEDLQDLDRDSFESSAGGAKRSHAVDDHEVDHGSSDEDGSTRAPPAKAAKRANGAASTVVDDDFLRPVKRAESVSTGASPAASKKPRPGKPEPKVEKKSQPAILKRQKPAAKSGERGDDTGVAVPEKKTKTKTAASSAAAAAAARPKTTPEAVEPEAEAEEDDFLLPVTDSSKAQRVTATLTPAKDKDDSEDAEGGDEQGGKRKRRNRKRGKRKKAAADGGDDTTTNAPD